MFSTEAMALNALNSSWQTVFTLAVEMLGLGFTSVTKVCELLQPLLLLTVKVVVY